ncbi:TRAP transporter permease [Phocicoccus pinnipedialis]|uniref:Sialic acid TRAP transporter permease protein SiaT n=1 Tax=Phocicoccus pinnipedialis TaxID=110845 RepID=A0A6V7RG37_9BACL|nr:TRAP transporter permease [Jeotgalicoccus pinnipedialis]MBP1939071.1 TRAP transporter 4TM/12TM fusion protein [Jeotgalicoccus pinnipedialis]CAD2076926.1 Sialic acid TRAP transporter permease protein SiaT [Jeotgalicoccus pinnipedialis]
MTRYKEKDVITAENIIAEKGDGLEANVQEVLEKYDRDSTTREFKSKYVAIIVSLIAVFYALFHVYIVFNPIPTLQARAIHVAVGLALIFLLYPIYKNSDRTKAPIYDWILAILGLATAGYIVLNYTAIVSERGGIPNTMDLVFAVLTVVLIFEATRRVTGFILPILALIFLIYPFISSLDFMPNLLYTRPFDFADVFAHLYTKTEGLYSTAIGASVNFIFLFILFGAFLQKSGMGLFFNDLALALAGGYKGGPAKVAVVSSGFMGSINGAAVANVVSTGAFTIPLMRKVGYGRTFAGAVEASSSIGGQILPPIMGASAFIMAETTGIKYSTIALAAVIPAFLYFGAVIMQVHLRAGRNNLSGISKAALPQISTVLKERGHLLLPIIALIYMLYLNLPIGRAAIYTIVITILVAQIRKTTRMSFKDVFEALELGAKQSLSVMIACAIVGVIIGVVSLTSFGSVLASAIAALGAGSLLLTCIFTMIASLVLGMGLPSIPAYIITATMAAPALAEYGVPVLVAHMFVFYFGIFANVTPPVALAAFAGAGISGGDPMKTGFAAFKLSLAGFLVPFVFVFNPALLMVDVEGLATNAREYPMANMMDVVIVVTTTVIGIVAISAAFEGYFATNLNWLFRILIGAAALSLIIPETITDIIGLAVVIIVFVLNIIKSKKEKMLPV